MIEDAYTVDADILLFEGNYLLLDEPAWKSIREEYSDFSLFLKAAPALLKDRLENYRRIMSREN